MDAHMNHPPLESWRREEVHGYLMRALETSNPDLDRVQRALLSADVMNLQDWNGETALHRVVRRGAIDCLEFLIAAGADVNAMSGDQEPPLMRALEQGSEEIAGILLNAGARAEVREGAKGWTALMHATANSAHAVMRLLLAHGADVYGEDEFGTTVMDLYSDDEAENILRTHMTLLERRALDTVVPQASGRETRKRRL